MTASTMPLGVRRTAGGVSGGLLRADDPRGPLQRAGASTATAGVRALDGAWRDGHALGYRYGWTDGYTTREKEILTCAADAAHEVASTPMAVEVARRRGEQDQSDVAFDAYSTDDAGRRVWDDEARAALVAWCLHSWGEGDG